MKSSNSGTMGAMHIASRPSTLPPTTAVTTSRTGSASRALGRQLERDRLEQRAERVRQVIRALRERADARDVAGGAPRPLRAAIDDFGRELAELEQRLRRDAAPDPR
jgi:hypothetical protein